MADQLAGLKQGPPIYERVHSWAGQQAALTVEENNEGEDGTPLSLDNIHKIIGFGTAARLHPRREFFKGKARLKGRKRLIRYGLLLFVFLKNTEGSMMQPKTSSLNNQTMLKRKTIEKPISSALSDL